MRAGILGGIAAILLLAACAGRHGKCEAVPENYITAGKPVYRACSVNRSARGPTFSSNWNFNPTQGCGRATIEFVVNEFGIPERETARVILGNDTRLGEAMLQFLTSMRYEPARKNGATVAQLMTFERHYSRNRTNAKTPRAVAQSQGGPTC